MNPEEVRSELVRRMDRLMAMYQRSNARYLKPYLFFIWRMMIALQHLLMRYKQAKAQLASKYVFLTSTLPSYNEWLGARTSRNFIKRSLKERIDLNLLILVSTANFALLAHRIFDLWRENPRALSVCKIFDRRAYFRSFCQKRQPRIYQKNVTKAFEYYCELVL